MKRFIAKAKLKAFKTAVKFHDFMAKKEKGEAGLIVAISLIVIAVLLLVVFRNQIFNRISTGISTTGDSLDSIFAG